MIDWSRVSELRGEVGEEDFSEVVDLFLEEVDSVIECLSADADDTEAQLHFLKGSALNLGFTEFAEYCGLGESAAAAGQSLPISMAQLAEIYRTSREEFHAGLNTRLAG